MKRFNFSPYSVTALLTAALGLLLLLTALSWTMVSVDSPRVPAPMSYQMPQDITHGAATAEELQAALERPLFWKERRPIIQIAEEPQLATADGIRLVGVIIRGSERTALLNTGQGVERARVGETVAGWRVESMSNSRATLSAGDRTVEIDVASPRSELIQLKPVNP